MKNIITVFALLLASYVAQSQITISASDMPVAGDTLRYSIASAAGTTISPADSGANISWNYPLSPVSQAIDSYLTAFSVNPVYALTVGLTAFGYKVADSSPIPIPVPGISIRDIYTFFEIKSGPSRFQAQAFAANISGLPAAFNYSTPDVWYFFPLTYLRTDSSGFALKIAIPGLDTLRRKGYRKTRVDGWGTITTPYYTTPANCIRVRSEIHEVDSIRFGLLNLGFPINSVEYKWLVNGEHYPALWVTSAIAPGGIETINSIRYRDHPMADSTPVDTVSGVRNITPDVVFIRALPNPAVNGIVQLEIPQSWLSFDVELFDMSSRLIATYHNRKELDVSSLPSGQYICRIVSGISIGFAVFSR